MFGYSENRMKNILLLIVVTACFNSLTKLESAENLVEKCLYPQNVH